MEPSGETNPVREAYVYNVYTYMYIIYICMYIYICVYICVYKYIYVYIYVYVYVYVYVYIFLYMVYCLRTFHEPKELKRCSLRGFHIKLHFGL